MSICKAIKEKDVFKRNSIYLQENDDDRDFEFFVFVDSGNEHNQPLFLQALRVALGFDTDSKQNIHDFCQQNWNQRFQERSGQKTEFSLLNWLKIAIEDYPYRLFVLINPEKWQRNKADPTQPYFWKEQNQFLFKRICFIRKEDFQEIVATKGNSKKEDYQKLINWLHAQWLLHLFRCRFSLTPTKAQIHLHRMDDPADRFYVPSTARFFYNGQQLQDIQSMPPQKTLEGLQLTFNTISIDPISEDEEIGDTPPEIFLSRHHDVYQYGKSNKKWDPGERKPQSNFWVSYNLSGELPSFIHLHCSLGNFSENSSKRFFMTVVEHALTRIAIADERFHEWYETMTLEQASGLFQSRIIGLYCFATNEKIQGQGSIPEHGIFLRTDLEEKLNLIWGKGQGENFQELWEEKFKQIDMLVIHQGLLDKFSEKMKRKSIEEYILEWKKIVPWIFVTSGRGKPEDVPLGTKFLPFSGLESCMIGKRFDKYMFLKQIISI